MKGFSIGLPINILVIVAIAVIVLLGLIALYFVGWGPFAGTAGLEGIKNSACRVLVQGNNCAVETSTITISNFDADGDGSNDPASGFNWNTPNNIVEGDNLAALCYYQYARTSDAACKTLCNCPGV